MTSTDVRTLAGEAWAPIVRFFLTTAIHRQRILGDEGLTPNDARALMSLDGREGRSMGELADLWACDASNATWIVDRLEERGLAERRTVSGDRRVKSVVLTSRGVKTRERVLRRMSVPPPELLALPREDLLALRDALAKLPSAHARPGGAAARPGRG